MFNITFTATLIALCSQDFNEKKICADKKKTLLLQFRKKPRGFIHTDSNIWFLMLL